MICILVERPNGTTFEQKVALNGKSVKDTITSYKRCLGKGYLICDWWTI